MSSDGFDVEKIEHYEDIVLSLDEIEGIKEIKGRKYGNNEVIDIVILVSSALGIKEAHEIATKVENVLINNYGVYDVIVHVEPN